MNVQQIEEKVKVFFFSFIYTILYHYRVRLQRFMVKSLYHQRLRELIFACFIKCQGCAFVTPNVDWSSVIVCFSSVSNDKIISLGCDLSLTVGDINYYKMQLTVKLLEFTAILQALQLQHLMKFIIKLRCIINGCYRALFGATLSYSV